MRSDTEIKLLLLLIVFILLFGAGAVLNALSIVFWIAVVLLIIVLILVGLGYLAGAETERQTRREIQKQDEEVERIQYELEHPGKTMKKWLGLYIETEKKQGKFTDSSLFYLLVVTGGLVGLFFLAIVVVVIIKIFSSMNTNNSINYPSNGQNSYYTTYSNQELKKMGD